MSEYDSLAEVYECWSTGDPAYFVSKDFYVKEVGKYSGVIVELGIGTGRIALDIARGNKSIIGVDISNNMLSLCREKFKKNGLGHRLSLINASISNFKLEEKADLIYLPFRTVGHLIGYECLKQAFVNIYNQLKQGGVFIFDHYIFDKDWAECHDRITRLMACSQNIDGTHTYVWDTYSYDFQSKIMDCIITIEKSNKDYIVVQKAHYPLTFSWIDKEEFEKLIEEVGFTVVDLLGEFSGEKFDENSTNQIWILKK